MVQYHQFHVVQLNSCSDSICNADIQMYTHTQIYKYVAELCLTLLQERGNSLKEIGVLFSVPGYKDAG